MPVTHDQPTTAPLPPADPMGDFRALLTDAPTPRSDIASQVRADLDRGGQVADLAAWYAGWTGTTTIRRPILALYASSYSAEPDSARDARTRLEQLAQGGGAINRFARALGAGVDVFDLALDRPVPDAADAPPMTGREVAATMAFGLEGVAKTPDLLMLCDAAPGSERAAAALIAGLLEASAEDAAAPEDYAWTRRALARAEVGSDAWRAASPIAAVAALGGREIAALSGAILAARASGTPVLLEGMAALAAALVVFRMDPDAIAHVRVAGSVDHPAHRLGCAALGRTPALAAAAGAAEGAGCLAILAILGLAAGADPGA